MHKCMICGAKSSNELFIEKGYVSFHQFPPKQDAARREAWLEFMGLNEESFEKLIISPSYRVVCSLHFEKKYMYLNHSQRRLTHDAVPTLQKNKKPEALQFVERLNSLCQSIIDNTQDLVEDNTSEDEDNISVLDVASDETSTEDENTDHNHIQRTQNKGVLKKTSEDFVETSRNSFRSHKFQQNFKSRKHSKSNHSITKTGTVLANHPINNSKSHELSQNFQTLKSSESNFKSNRKIAKTCYLQNNNNTYEFTQKFINTRVQALKINTKTTQISGSINHQNTQNINNSTKSDINQNCSEDTNCTQNEEETRTLEGLLTSISEYKSSSDSSNTYKSKHINLLEGKDSSEYDDVIVIGMHEEEITDKPLERQSNKVHLVDTHSSKVPSVDTQSIHVLSVDTQSSKVPSVDTQSSYVLPVDTVSFKVSSVNIQSCHVLSEGDNSQPSQTSPPQDHSYPAQSPEQSSILFKLLTNSRSKSIKVTKENKTEQSSSLPPEDKRPVLVKVFKLVDGTDEVEDFADVRLESDDGEVEVVGHVGDNSHSDNEDVAQDSDKSNAEVEDVGQVGDNSYSDVDNSEGVGHDSDISNAEVEMESREEKLLVLKLQRQVARFKKRAKAQRYKVRNLNQLVRRRNKKIESQDGNIKSLKSLLLEMKEMLETYGTELNRCTCNRRRKKRKRFLEKVQDGLDGIKS